MFEINFLCNRCVWLSHHGSKCGNCCCCSGLYIHGYYFTKTEILCLRALWTFIGLDFKSCNYVTLLILLQTKCAYIVSYMHIPSSYLILLVNPLSPSVSISILVTGHHTFVVVLIWRSCSDVKRVHLLSDRFLNSQHLCAHWYCALILQGEIWSWSLLGLIKGWTMTCVCVFISVYL